jgi:hypothetical protein
MKVYVAGKLNDMACDYIKNLSVMCKASIELKKLGYAAYNPALDILEGIIAGDFTYQDYFKPNYEWMQEADVIFVLPNYTTSHGALAEIQKAQDLNIPVVYSITELEVIKMRGDRSKNQKLRDGK